MLFIAFARGDVASKSLFCKQSRVQGSIPSGSTRVNSPHDLVDFFTLRGIVASSNILANTLHWMAAKRHEETEEDRAMTREARPAPLLSVWPAASRFRQAATRRSAFCAFHISGLGAGTRAPGLLVPSSPPPGGLAPGLNEGPVRHPTRRAALGAERPLAARCRPDRRQTLC